MNTCACAGRALVAVANPKREQDTAGRRGGSDAAVYCARFELMNMSPIAVTGAAHARAKPLLWKVSNPRADAGVRSADWKLIVPNGRRSEPELYQLRADPGETRNLAAERPDVVKRLLDIATAWGAALPKEYDKSGAKGD